jgi:Ankyrin repeat
LSACRRGAIHLLDKLFYDASLVPARPDELPSTDEMVLEALDAPSTGMLSAVIRRDRKYKWSDLAIIKAIEKDKAYDPPLYLDAFLYLGLCPHTIWDKEVEHHDALMWAIRSGSAEFVSMLLCAGADPNGAKVGRGFCIGKGDSR